MRSATVVLSAFAHMIFAIVAAPAWAQSAYDPVVAYTQPQGKSTQLYLANADGSHAVPVASVSKNIVGIDFAPGGGRIAFSDSEGLKLLDYSASISGITVSGTQVLVSGRTARPDFSSDGSRILYTNTGNEFFAVSAAGGTPVFLYRESGLSSPRWLRSGALGNGFAAMKPYSQDSVTNHQIRVVLLDGDDNVTSVTTVPETADQEFGAIEDFDTARTRDGFLLSVGYRLGYPITNNMVELDLLNRVVTPVAGEGHRAHYSADDTRIIFRNRPARRTPDHVYSVEVATGNITRLTNKGTFQDTDAAPEDVGADAPKRKS